MCVVNDPLGQTHIPASSGHYFQLKLVMFCAILKSGDGRTTCVKRVITTVRDCGSTEWIKQVLRIDE